MQKLNGPFKDIIPILIEAKRSIGYKYNNIKPYYEIDNFLYENNINKLDSRIFKLAITDEKNEYLKRRRYSALENINVILSLLNIKEIPMGKIKLKNNEKFVARVLDKKEIKILFKKIDSESKKINSKMFPVLFRLLYGCGLRISEALSLETADYSRKNGALLIRNSKNRITRNVVLSSSFKKIFEEYLVQKNLQPNELIFDISYHTVRTFFQKRIIELSLEPCRLHDLRHTFAVHSLDKILKEMDEDKALYYLSVYMGHSNIESTAYYIHLTKDFIKKVKKYTKDTSKYIFPEVNNER